MLDVNKLNSIRTTNYVFVIILVIVFFVSTYSIGFINKEEQDEKVKKHGRFALPTLAMTSFFICCYFIANVIFLGDSELLESPRDQYSGIWFLAIIAVILSIINFTVLKENKIKKYIKGKKFSVTGILMALGVSAIVFGFLDNFGMKLGTEALDDNFVQLFLGPFSQDNRFKEHKEDIRENLQRLNVWASGKWRSVINFVLRYKDKIAEHNDLQPLSDRIKKFIEDDDAKELKIPEGLSKNDEDKNSIKNFVQSIKQKYDVIDGSKAMMGNTFSDFMGAIIGAAIINLFMYMTAYDGVYTGDDNVDNSFLSKNLNMIAPFMEAFFIAFGCLVPVFLNIAMTRDPNNSNNSRAWIIVIVIALITVIMMGLSVYGIKDMTLKDKKNSIKKTLTDLRDRLDIKESVEEETTLYKELDAFINSVAADV